MYLEPYFIHLPCIWNGPNDMYLQPYFIHLHYTWNGSNDLKEMQTSSPTRKLDLRSAAAKFHDSNPVYRRH
jgi:hypothetical protein